MNRQPYLANNIWTVILNSIQLQTKMGCKNSSLRSLRSIEPQLRYCKLVILGLDNSGKTSILDSLSNITRSTTPTIGVSPTTLIYNQSWKIVAFDVPGSISQQWAMYTDKAQAIIFVIDCSDIKRMNKSKSQLHRIDNLVHNALFLIYLNKQDQMQQHQIDLNWLEILEIQNLKNEVIVQKCSVKNGQGVKQGLNKLINILQQKQSQTNSTRSQH